MNYRETLEYLYSQLPVFTRTGKAAYKANLDNILALCAALGNPEKDLRCVHIAGTNGKGSCSHFIASVLQETGYKTGLFTSPHLKDFRERIRVNGQLIPRREVARFTAANRALFERLKPSFFEMNTALAFSYFQKQQVDIAVIETGLGGRLDSTNVISPEVSLITNISYDHTDLLGDTLEKIASEKAGIIKPGIPVVIGEHVPESDPVFIVKATTCQSPLYVAEDLVTWKNEKQVFLRGRLLLEGEALVSFPGRKPYSLSVRSPLSGTYQVKNIRGVLATLELLRDKGWKIPLRAIERGIRNVMGNTELHGRWELIGKKPYVICDTGHNEAGVWEVLQQVAAFPHNKLHVVWGMVGDKDVTKVLSLLPQDAVYYFCRAAIPRSLDERLLQAKALTFGLKGKSYKTVRHALSAAKRSAWKGDLILLGGSTFVVGEII